MPTSGADPGHRERKRGYHRVYLGAAPGVGKTFAMLNEGSRRAGRGDDVVIGWFEEHGRPETTARAEGLEVVPPLLLGHRGAELREMDVDAVLARRPALALVDELAHTNAPGSRNPKRWQDVEALLEAGISVISTLNIQHLESINDVVERITGVRQRETIPDSVVRRADQIELVDLTPEALRNRLARGDVYAPAKIDAALANFFRPGNLGALRELALLWVADRVEEALDDYVDAHGIADSWETRERVVVAVSGRAADEALVRRASRIAARGRGELLCVHVGSAHGLRTGADPEALASLRRLAGDLGGSFHEIAGGEVAASLLDFARAEHATQLVLGASSRSRWAQITRGSIINDVNRGSGQIDVHIISEVRGVPAPAIEGPGQSGPARPSGARRPAAELHPRRTLAAAALLLAGLPLLTLAMLPLREEIGLASVSLLYMGLVVALAIFGGWRWAVAGGLIAAVALNYFFTEPLYTLRVDESPVFVSLLVFALLAAVIGLLVGRIGRRTAEAGAARREAEALAYVAGAHDEQLREMVAAIRGGFGLAWVGVYEQEADSREWSLLTAAGEAPADPESAEVRLPAAEGVLIALGGRPLSGDDRRVLAVLARQLGAGIERGRLRRAVEDAAALAATDRLRTALLRAVSHDLRTPLSSIKASVSSLLASDVSLSASDQAELLAVVDSETDRLDRLVGNLLDMSRLDAGAVEPRIEPVALEEAVAVVLGAIGAGSERVETDLDPSLPRVEADFGLLERALANLIENALNAAPEGRVTVAAGRAGERIDLSIIDHGPGIPAGDRERIFEPFQRLGDRGTSRGSGLGLAVARGFIEAVGARIELDDTPGGGLTVVVSLAIAEGAVAPAPGAGR